MRLTLKLDYTVNVIRKCSRCAGRLLSQYLAAEEICKVSLVDEEKCQRVEKNGEGDQQQI